MAPDLSLVQSLVKAAMAAPSGDNCQPLRFVWRDPVLEIHDCPERGRGAVNVDNFGTWFTLGAALKNMELVAVAHGRKLKTSLHFSTTKMAEVSFENVPVQNSPSLAVLFSRVVNRKAYRRAPLEQAQKEKLLSAAQPSGAVRLDYVETRPEVDVLAAALGVGDGVSLFNKMVHHYLYRWLRWTPQEVERTRDGMAIATMELNAFNRINAFLMRWWPWVKINSFIGAETIFKWQRENLYRQSAGFGLVSVQDWTPQNVVSAGEFVQTMWLKAAELGMAFHGMMGLPLFVHMAEKKPGEILSAGHHKRILAAMEKVKSAVPSLRGRELAFVFRVGEASAPSTRTLRLPVESVLETA